MAESKSITGAYDATSIAVAGLRASRYRLNVSAANLANVESAGYKRRDVFQTAAALPGGAVSFSSTLDGMTLMKPEISAVVEDQSAPRMDYQPNNPKADANGYVALPNINIVEEMTNMMSASRLYQACAVATETARGMGSEARRILTQG
jgi:flagellar basal-body rod protein FlgC